MQNDISDILFDLGRVLIDLNGPPPLRDEWLPSPMTEDEKWQRWCACPAVAAYEAGKISSTAFLQRLIADFQLKVSAADLQQAFVAWPKGFLPGAEALLQHLKPRYNLGFYSNTSELHLPQLMQRIGLAQYFKHTFASYEIGFVKPDMAGFEYVLANMGVASHNILFIDDLPANVAAAREVGMRAEQALGVEQVKQMLKLHGCGTAFSEY